MKKKFIALNMLALMSHGALAEDNSVEKESWFGGFVEYYNADNEKFLPAPQFNDGFGLGLEYGIRFSPSWASRIEWSHVNLETKGPKQSIGGDRGGIDVLFFPQQSDYYVFTGLKIEKYDDTQRLVNVGLGRHWKTNSNFKIITEIAAHHDFGEGFNDHSVKVGFSYAFGGEKKATRSAARIEDTDRDGVQDNRDLCPNTPANSRVDNTGCVMAKPVVADSDNDGIPNNKDACANTPSIDKVDSKGCSIFEDKEVRMQLDMKFAHNSSIVNKNDMSQLEAFSTFLTRFPNTKVVIEGHSSSLGDKQYNVWLSKKRAESVKNILVKEYNINSDRIDVVGYGDAKLLDNSGTIKAHKVNRRIMANVTAVERKKITK
ncbi:OmpA family protein [Pseudocolwellia agarivorans]|uniref:OmpA family protein n=1 Tax=Pseudocolwellia agarivorans TaxID=1911682 RepID=UPI000984405A|nr:OmpA family protein [Pseudocolwellia agarivorans]